MNALVSFRSNAVGNYAATPEQRKSAAEQVVSTFKTKLLAAVENAAKADSASKAATASADTTSKSAATASESTATNKSSDTSDTKTPEGVQDAYASLDAAAYIKLLAVQLSNQDPTEPMDNNQMMAQLAQFSSLQQMTEVNESISALTETMNSNLLQSNFLAAQGMLGKYVTGMNADDEEIKGLVTGVTLKDNVVVLSVGGHSLPITSVSSVALEAPEDSGAASKETGA